MNDLRRDAIERRSSEYRTTKTQRRQINALIRDAYDMATELYEGENFQVTLHTEDLPSPLTDRNKNYFDKEFSLIDMNKLFGHIAVDSTIYIDDLKKRGYRISLRREIPDPSDSDPSK